MASSSTHREPLVPTINFSMVCPGVYRSGYPTKKNYSFLCALRLRSILYLCPEDYAESNLKFCEENGIHVLRFPTEGNKEPFNDISEPLMHRILGAICDTRNLPLLIHCNKGKHRTGTVVACLRHLQGWSLVSIFEEYKRFASDKARVGDQQYVELYHPIVKLTPPFVAPWVTINSRVTLVTSDRELMEAETIQLDSSLLAPDKPAGKVKGQSKGAVATTTAAASPVGPSSAATSVSGAPPPPSPNMQAAPPVAATTAPPPPPQAPPLPLTVASSPSGVTGSTAAGLSTTASSTAVPATSASASLPPTPPPAGAKQSLTTPVPAHAVSNNNNNNTNTTTAAAPPTGGGSSVTTPVPTTTTTNVMTNTTAAATGDGGVAPLAGGATLAAATAGPGNSSAQNTSGNNGLSGKGLSPSTSWHSPTMGPPSQHAFTTAPTMENNSHRGGGGGETKDSADSANSQSSIPPLDNEMRL